MSRRHFTIRVIQLFNPVIAMHMKSHKMEDPGELVRTSTLKTPMIENEKREKEQESDNQYILEVLSSQYHVQRI